MNKINRVKQIEYRKIITNCASKVRLDYETIKKELNLIVSEGNKDLGLHRDTGKISNKTILRNHFGKDAESLIDRGGVSRVNKLKHMNKEFLRMLLIHLGATPDEMIRVVMSRVEYEQWKEIREFSGHKVLKKPDFIIIK